MRRATARLVAVILLATSALLTFRLQRLARDDGPRLAEILPPSPLAVAQVPSLNFLADRLAASPLGAWTGTILPVPAARHDPRAPPPGPWALAQRLLASARQAGGEAFVACTGLSISPRLDLDLLAGFDAGSPAAASAAVAAWSHRCHLEFPELRATETRVDSLPCESWQFEGAPPLLVANFSRWVLASRGERPMREAILQSRTAGLAKRVPPLGRAPAGDARVLVSPAAFGEQLRPLVALQPSLQGQFERMVPFEALAGSLRVRQGAPEESWRWSNPTGAPRPSALSPCRRDALRFAGPDTAAGLLAALDWVAAIPIDGMAAPVSPDLGGPLAEKLKGILPLAEIARLAPHLGPEAGLFMELDASGAPVFLLVVRSRNETALREGLRGAGAKLPSKPVPGHPPLATLGKPPSAWTCGLADGWLLLSESPAAVARAIARGTVPGRLEVNPGLRAAMAPLPADASAVGFMDCAVLADLLSRAGTASDSPLPEPLRGRLAGLDMPRLAAALRRAGWATAAVRTDLSGGELCLRGPITPLALATLLALRVSP